MNRSRVVQLLLLGVLPILSLAASAAFQIRTVKVGGADYLLLRDVAAYYGMECSSGPKQTRLHSRYSDLRFNADRREATLNDVEVHLSHAPLTWRQEMVVSETDFRLLLDPILRSRSLPRQTVRRILIDPGHGGRDKGASGRTLHEKDIVLSIALRLGRRLEEAGYHVTYTRQDDSAVALARRTDLAARVHADVFVSLHVNATGTPSVRGIETFLLSPAGTSSTYSSRASSGKQDGNRHDKENALLAYLIQKHVTASSSAEDRGIRHARFQVLKDAPCAAALVELGFISNDSDERNLGSAAYRERLAEGLFRAISSYQQSLAPRQ